MATTRTVRKPATQEVAQQPAAPTENVSEADLQAPSAHPPVSSSADLRRLQRQAGSPEGDRIHVRLCIDGSDADGVRFFDEELPVTLVHAMLDPQVANFFIPIRGDGRIKPRRARGHWFHTQYIREIILLDELPEENT